MKYIIFAIIGAIVIFAIVAVSRKAPKRTTKPGGSEQPPKETTRPDDKEQPE